MSARTAPARRRPARAKNAKRRPAAKKSRRPQLDDRQLDLLGLALVAAAVFFAFLIWLGWDGGRVGGSAVEGLRWLVGEVHYVAPVALMAAGAIVVLREFLPAVRPFRAGGGCLFLGLTLALAAGTLGLGPSGPRHGNWDVAWAKSHGGMVGEALFWLSSTLLGPVGAHIIALFLLLAGTLLLTGASVAGIVKATSDSVSTTTRALRDSHAEMRASVTRTRRRPARDELAALEVGEPRVSRRTSAPPPLDEVAWDAGEDPGEFIPGVEPPVDDDVPTGEIEAAALPQEPSEPEADAADVPGDEPRLAEDPDTD
jgi:S-DNA-T family DNA segregation ATPase FtsK/SpoIIIE